MGLLETAISGSARRTSHSHVVNELGKAIIGGVYPVGSILPGDNDLAARFQVSRTVLREAMKTLSAKGLVMPRARIGTRVTERKQWNLFDADVLAWHLEQGVDRTFLVHLSEMRLSFEPYAAGLAASRADTETARHLQRLAGEMTAAPSHEDLILADLRFHLAVLQASENPFMYGVGTLIEAALVAAFGLSSPHAPSREARSIGASHEDIAEAIARGDAEGASEAMRKVIVTGRDHALERLQGAQR
ncbi:FadR/GntR family transcriptional regulator [Chelativorans intermedius]|uniref:FadR/GntR family transcriptional regulator n=1 Tax=Chelativorans intermedius TaxID=515947 RepID=A0ABV6D512_9HYPH|nr:FadR/GntR family transcriptional regulator [Chelativorans intermedius]MCT8999067.1 FadR family transcriptional regulator [Chelativorans intermedius]